ncbi:MAG: class I SAM-dependent methyltransferase [Betaproteobacteria bacterium]|nr:MAG: class I SAM-dependent methyltransferase [Betaproteobacteria bacterium]
MALLCVAACSEIAPIRPYTEVHAGDGPHPGYLTALRTREGVGKYYLGREIAHYMSHQGASWLERPERAKEEHPDLLMTALALKQGDVVVDMGCGTGYYSWRVAERVGAQGKVLGVDIQPEMLALWAKNMAARNLLNVEAVLGTTTDPRLPAESVDLMLLVDVYHEFDHPFEMTRAMIRALKPGGRIVMVEYRLEDTRLPISTAHKMSEAQIKKEMAVHPVVWVETNHALPWQHMVIFRKQ